MSRHRRSAPRKSFSPRLASRRAGPDSRVSRRAQLLCRPIPGNRTTSRRRSFGVWRIEQADDGRLLVRHAQRGCTEERVDLNGLRARLAPYFEPAGGGHLIDQAWQPRLTEGMVRAYLVEDRVVGLGVQAVNALHPEAARPGPRLYHGPDLPGFRPLVRQLQSTWIPLLLERVGLARERLPLLWDCDFIGGGPTADGAQRFVLCEINVSSVSPFPPSAIAPLVEAVRRRVRT